MVLLPAITVCEAGVADTVKSGCGVASTVKVAVTEWVKLPLVPVMVRVKVPTGTEELVVIVSVEEPEPLTEAGLKPAVLPIGKPLRPNDTFPVKPLTGLIVTV